MSSLVTLKYSAVRPITLFAIISIRGLSVQKAAITTFLGNLGDGGGLGSGGGSACRVGEGANGTYPALPMLLMSIPASATQLGGFLSRSRLAFCLAMMVRISSSSLKSTPMIGCPMIDAVMLLAPGRVHELAQRVVVSHTFSTAINRIVAFLSDNFTAMVKFQLG